MELFKGRNLQVDRKKVTEAGIGLFLGIATPAIIWLLRSEKAVPLRRHLAHLLAEEIRSGERRFDKVTHGVEDMAEKVATKLDSVTEPRIPHLLKDGDDVEAFLLSLNSDLQFFQKGTLQLTEQPVLMHTEKKGPVLSSPVVDVYVPSRVLSPLQGIEVKNGINLPLKGKFKIQIKCPKAKEPGKIEYGILALTESTMGSIKRYEDRLVHEGGLIDIDTNRVTQKMFDELKGKWGFVLVEGCMLDKERKVLLPNIYGTFSQK